jgi:hypothetical protein
VRNLVSCPRSENYCVKGGVRSQVCESRAPVPVTGSQSCRMSVPEIHGKKSILLGKPDPEKRPPPGSHPEFPCPGVCPLLRLLWQCWLLHQLLKVLSLSARCGGYWVAILTPVVQSSWWRTEKTQHLSSCRACFPLE